MVSVPVAIWWYSAYQQRNKVAHDVATRIRIPGQQTTDDFLIEKCRPGDVLLFDRRWETCASGPWAALACIVAKTFLCHHYDDHHRLRSNNNNINIATEGQFDHMGIVVPGYIRSKQDEFDPSNLLLLEATPQGIVARSLKTRLERTQSRSVLLMQLNLPGEQRDFDSTNYDDDDDNDNDDDNNHNNNKDDKDLSKLSSRELSVRRTRKYLERELIKFRDKFVSLGQEYHFHRLYSTMTIGGGLLYGLGMAGSSSSSSSSPWLPLLQGPVSPSAWLVLMALQQGAAAQNLNERNERFLIKPQDFVRHSGGGGRRSILLLDDNNSNNNALRLRPGWRFLAPISLRDHHT